MSKGVKHNAGELIKYNGVYYLIDKINYNIERKSCDYKLSHVNKFNVRLQDKLIDSNDSKIITINRDIEPDQNIIDKQPTYTAISRAKEKCFVISSDKEFINCQRIKSDDKKMSQFMEISDNYKFE